MITTGKDAFLTFQLHCGVSAVKVGTWLNVQSSQHVFFFLFFLFFNPTPDSGAIIIGNSKVKGGGLSTSQIDTQKFLFIYFSYLGCFSFF